MKGGAAKTRVSARRGWGGTVALRHIWCLQHVTLGITPHVHAVAVGVLPGLDSAQTRGKSLETLGESGTQGVVGGEAGAGVVLELGEGAASVVELLGKVPELDAGRACGGGLPGAVSGGWGKIAAHDEQCSAAEGRDAGDGATVDAPPHVARRRPPLVV